MTKARQKLIEDIRADFGDDGARAVSFLFDMGTLDDVLARRHNIAVEVFRLLRDTQESQYQIYENVAEDHGVSFSYVRKITARH